jgi:hypothetical protein
MFLPDTTLLLHEISEVEVCDVIIYDTDARAAVEAAGWPSAAYPAK